MDKITKRFVNGQKVYEDDLNILIDAANAAIESSEAAEHSAEQAASSANQTAASADVIKRALEQLAASNDPGEATYALVIQNRQQIAEHEQKLSSIMSYTFATDEQIDALWK